MATPPPVPPPSDEARRLQALAEYRVLDTQPEQAYDDIVRLASYICQTPIALVSLIDRDRQWFKARTGLAVPATPREHALCAHAIARPDDVMLVADATQDARFVGNPLVTGEPHIRFYAGVPLVTPTGEALGTLCVIDRTPRELSTEQLEVLRALSRQVMAQMELRRSIDTLEAAVIERDAYVEQLERYQRELEQTQTQLDQRSATDALTGVRNRGALERRLEEEVARTARGGAAPALVMADVDHFKQYNDRHGHPAGDEVLRRVAQLLQQAVRPYDLVARYGGEEFALVLPATATDVALVIAERCRRTLQRAVWPHGPVTASFGVAAWAGAMASATDLLTSADRALYEAKHRGRNRVSVAEPQHRMEVP